jgi:hypothetical protein
LEAGQIAQEMGDEQAMIAHFTHAYEALKRENQSRDFTCVFYTGPLLDFDLVSQLIPSPMSQEEMEDFEELVVFLERSGAESDTSSVREWLHIQ